MNDLSHDVLHKLYQNKSINVIWTLGDLNKKADIKVILSYSLAEGHLPQEQQSILLQINKIGIKKKLTLEKPSVEVSIPHDKKSLGLKGIIQADFIQHIVFFQGDIFIPDVNTTLVCCPPTAPLHGNKYIIFNW